jgi:hypothetical protein
MNQINVNKTTPNKSSQNIEHEDKKRTYHSKKRLPKPNTSRPIRGKAIFIKTLVEYLYDRGADRTIINTQLYNQIKQDDNTTSQLQPYANKSLVSANGPMDVEGVLKLNRCVLGDKTTNLEEAEVVVTNDFRSDNCLLERPNV